MEIQCGNTLWKHSVEKHGEKNTVEIHCGNTLWKHIVEAQCEHTLWKYTPFPKLPITQRVALSVEGIRYHRLGIRYHRLGIMYSIEDLRCKM